MGRHAIASDLHRELLAVRRELAHLTRAPTEPTKIDVISDRGLMIDRRGTSAVLLFNFGERPIRLAECVESAIDWATRFDSAAGRWQGPQNDEPHSDNAVLRAKSCRVLVCSRPGG
jgi:hypothetical protein